MADRKDQRAVVFVQEGEPTACWSSRVEMVVGCLIRYGSPSLCYVCYRYTQQREGMIRVSR